MKLLDLEFNDFLGNLFIRRQKGRAMEALPSMTGGDDNLLILSQHRHGI